MAGWRGVQNLESPEAHRQGLPWGDYESPGRNDSKRNVASKQLDPRAEPAAAGRRQHGMPKSDRCGVPPRRGVSDSTVTRTRRVAGEASLVPVRNHRSKVDRITGQTGKSIEGERVADGSVVDPMQARRTEVIPSRFQPGQQRIGDTDGSPSSKQPLARRSP